VFKDYSVLTEAHQIQRAFRMRFAGANLKPRPEFTRDLLVSTMKIYNDWHKSLMYVQKINPELTFISLAGR
jgi:hypothetical protein